MTAKLIKTTPQYSLHVDSFLKKNEIMYSKYESEDKDVYYFINNDGDIKIQDAKYEVMPVPTNITPENADNEDNPMKQPEPDVADENDEIEPENNAHMWLGIGLIVLIGAVFIMVN